MREGPSSEVLAGAAGWRPRLASWRDGVLLAAEVPIAGGRLSASVSLDVPERLQFTVPDEVDGFSWAPGKDHAHPLSKYGTEIDLAIVVTSSVGGAETVTRIGRFPIYEWEHDEVTGMVRVTAFGRLQTVAEDRFLIPEAPRAGGTLGSEFRRLMSPGIPVSIAAELVDRPCPQSLQWPQDRLAALYEIADAWPARIRSDQWGGTQLLPVLPDVPTPVVILAEGHGGTAVSAPTTDTRASAYNIVVGTSTETDSPSSDPLRAVARIDSGPMAATDDGTGYRRAVKYWTSPLVSNLAQLQAAVNAQRDDLARPAVVRTVTHAPDPRIDLDDAVEVRSAPFEEVTEAIVITPAIDTMTLERVNTCVDPQATSITGWSGPNAAVVAAPWGTGTAVRSIATGTSTVWVFSARSAVAHALASTVTVSARIAATAGLTHVLVSVHRRTGNVYYGGTGLGRVVPVPAGGRLSETLTLPEDVPANDLDIAVLGYGGANQANAAAGSYLYVGEVLIEAAASAGDYFCGDTPDTAERMYLWTGPVNASTSAQMALPQPAVTRTETRLEPLTREWGWVVGYELPLTIHDGPARTDVAVRA